MSRVTKRTSGSAVSVERATTHEQPSNALQLTRLRIASHDTCDFLGLDVIVKSLITHSFTPTAPS